MGFYHEGVLPRGVFTTQGFYQVGFLPHGENDFDINKNILKGHNFVTNNATKVWFVPF